MNMIINTCNRFYLVFWLSLLFLLEAKGVYAGKKINSLGAEEVYLEVQASKLEVFRGEPFILTINLYYSIPVIDPGDELKVAIRDAYLEEYQEEPSAKVKTIGGKKFHIRTLKKILVIPQKEGLCIIPPFSRDVKFNKLPEEDDFFGIEKIVSKKLETTALSVKVLELPANPFRIPFSGAVGEFKLKSDYRQHPSKSNLLELNIELAGYGNLRSSLITIPSIQGLQVFPAEDTKEEHLRNRGLLSKQHISFKLLANYRHRYLIPGGGVLVFNPKKAEYEVLSVSPFTWDVNVGPPLPHLAKPGKMKRVATGNLIVKSSADKDFYIATSACFVLSGVSVFLFSLALVWQQWAKRTAQNELSYKRRTARRSALKHLRAINKKLSGYSDDDFYKITDSVLASYLSQKLVGQSLTLEVADLNAQLAALNVPPGLCARVHQVFEATNMVRFSKRGPVAGKRSLRMDNISDLINSLELVLNEGINT